MCYWCPHQHSMLSFSSFIIWKIILFLSLLLNEVIMGNHDENRKEFYHRLSVLVPAVRGELGVGHLLYFQVIRGEKRDKLREEKDVARSRC